MTDRTTLALAACAGLSDTELADRGPQGFKKMIERKRGYAKAARTMAMVNAQLAIQMKQAKAKLAELEAKIATLEAIEQMDAPINDTTQAANLLAALSKTQGDAA